MINNYTGEAVKVSGTAISEEQLVGTEPQYHDKKFLRLDSVLFCNGIFQKHLVSLNFS